MKRKKNKEEKPKRSATLPDVAEEARVSLSTAARVLRNAPYPVSQDLAQRVHAVAAKLGYVPNLLARNLRGQTKTSLGLIVGNMSEPFFGQIADCITAEASNRSLLAIVANMRRDPRLEIAMCRKLFEHRVDGLILAGGGFDQSTYFSELQDLIAQLGASGVAMVSLSERNLSIPTFSANNNLIGRLLASEALKLGHAQIGVITGPTGSIVTQNRLNGLRAVLAAKGIKDSCVHTEFSFEEAARGVDALLATNPKITIILASTDMLGVAVLLRLKERGRKVPDEVSVISVGNTRYCGICSPTLSSIDTSVPSCCFAAIEYISAKWAGNEQPFPQPFPARLVRRESTT